MSARDTLERYEVEINKHSFDLLLPLVSQDCKFWFSSGTYSGMEQARRAFEKTWGMIKDEIYSITDVDWVAESDRAAVCTYTFHWEGFIDGESCRGSGRGTSCLRKDGEHWKIVHEHLSHFPKES